MFKFEQVGKEVTLTISTKLKSKRKQFILNELLKQESIEDAVDYLRSLKGKEVQGFSKIRRLKNKSARLDLLQAKQNGEVLKRYHSLFDCSVTHKPSQTSLGQWIGVEIECYIPKDKISPIANTDDCIHYCESCSHDEDGNDMMYVTDCGCSCPEGCSDDDTNDSYLRGLERYFKNKQLKRVSVHHDGSIECDDEYFGAELTVLFRRDDRTGLKKLCDELNKLEARVNASCGLHVHLDQRDLWEDGKLNRLKALKRGRNLERSLPVLVSMMPHSRRNNSYCRLKMSAMRSDADRYCAVNMTAISKYQTIEVRLHSATTDFEKITNWIDILLMISNSPRLTMKVETFDQFLSAFDVPEHLISYMESRIEKFTKPRSDESPEGTDEPANAA